MGSHIRTLRNFPPATVDDEIPAEAPQFVGKISRFCRTVHGE